ncbi:MAG: hypothetical protein JW924_05235 [Fusobacteriaceae bacterium]|nr:hypothetical protein [Fusobacteriaceae bacterium]
MPGFFISNIATNNKIRNFFDDKCIFEEINFLDFNIQRNTIPKFLYDKVFINGEDYIIIIEGVVFNKNQLMNKYGGKFNSFFETIISMYKKSGDAFFSQFRGSFSGAFYDKKLRKWLIFTNHTGEKAVFYYASSSKILVGSQVDYILKVLKENKIQVTFNEKAAYYMLTYAAMGDDSTFFSEIKRLTHGNYIKVENGLFEIKNYYTVSNRKYDLSKKTEEEMINNLDKLFRNAVKMHYDKDLEYRYDSLAKLSGGLDSRLNTIVANDLGYDNVMNVCFSQSFYLDNIISMKIATDLKNEYLFKALDDATWFTKIDYNIKQNFGQYSYSTTSQNLAMLSKINFDNIGLIHGGLIGDSVIRGDCLYDTRPGKPRMFTYCYSDRFKDRLDKAHYEKYENNELYGINLKALLREISTNINRCNYAELASPFADVDFLDYCMSIHHKYRKDHKIYLKWILSKYPIAGNYKWEKYNTKPTTNKFVLKYRTFKLRLREQKNDYLMDLYPRIFKEKYIDKKTMNPFEQWYYKDSNVKKKMDTYFNENIRKKLIGSSLRKDLNELYSEGTVFEKTQVLSVLGVVKNFFANDV